MTKVLTFYVTAVLALFQGCVDLSLLDDMRPIDAGSKQGGNSSQNGETDKDSAGTDDDPLLIWQGQFDFHYQSYT